MPFTPIPTPVAADATGLADGQWVTDVRDALKDYPKQDAMAWSADGVNGVVGANAMPLNIPKAPVNDGSVIVRDNTASVNYTVITSGSPGSGQVLVNLDTGELTFNAPPAANDVIQVSYQFCQWRDASIGNALYAGLRAMFPTVGRTYVDTSIAIQTLQWDYALPEWAQDPRAKVLKVEIEDPFIGIEPFRPLQNWEMVGIGTIHLPESQRYSPIAHLRVTGWGPYLKLGDLEPQLYHLPIWYALSVLLPKRESYRIRQDTMVPLTQEGGQQPGILTQTGDYYSKRFEIELQRLGRVMGPGWSIPIRSTRDRRFHY